MLFSAGVPYISVKLPIGKKENKVNKSFTDELTLLILMAQGAPGNPGRQVLKADISEKAPRPQALIPATRNL